MKRSLLLVSLSILACSLPLQIISGMPSATPTLTQIPISTPTLPAMPEPGTEKNPLILALAPSPRPKDEMTAAGEVIASFIESHSGYRIVTVLPHSERDLVDSFSANNVHIASLSPFAYLPGRRNGTVTVLLNSVHDGKMFYGAQLIASRESGLVPFYDAVRDENTAPASEALKQLDGKKPCWSDLTSPSGYVVPLGLLNQSQVHARSGAFLGGQPSVVRAVYARDICDFGATFIDARQSPALESDYPDVMDKVIVIWRIAEIIPYENISISTSLPFEMRRVIQRAFIDLLLLPDGKAAMQTVYGIDELQVAEDTMYREFDQYVAASGLDPVDLIEGSHP